MHHLNVFRRKFNVFIENLTELPNSMVAMALQLRAHEKFFGACLPRLPKQWTFLVKL
jgi:hypothetical protein